MKRLVLDRQNKKIAGVCAGIANYLEVDVTVVRILFLNEALLKSEVTLWHLLRRLVARP